MPKVTQEQFGYSKTRGGAFYKVRGGFEGESGQLAWGFRAREPTGMSFHGIPGNIKLDSLMQEAIDREDDDDDSVELEPEPRPPSTNPSTLGLESSSQTRDTGPADRRKARKNDSVYKRRVRKREARSNDSSQPYLLRPKKLTSIHLLDIASIPTMIGSEDYQVSGGGSYVGKRKGAGNKEPWTLDELQREGFTIILWDGVHPHAILDNEQRIIGALIGRPRRARDWDNVVASVWAEIKSMRGEVMDSEFNIDRRRGKFVALSSGVSFGGGQTKPGNLHPKRVNHRVVLDRALANSDVRRVMGFQNSSFATIGPKAYREIEKDVNALFAHDTTLRRNVPNSIYPAVTFNCGPQTVCLEHVDHGNAPNSMCAVTAFGDFDPTKGGHLVLVDLKLACEFPPGATALLLSSVIAHANTPVQEGEERGSLTQFCAGGLLRYVAHGFRTVSSIKLELGQSSGASHVRDLDGQPGERWKCLLGLFSKFDELDDDRKFTFPNLV